jgi:hypothetical protein
MGAGLSTSFLRTSSALTSYSFYPANLYNLWPRLFESLPGTIQKLSKSCIARIASETQKETHSSTGTSINNFSSTSATASIMHSQLYIATLCGINEKIPGLGALVIHSSLFVANQSVRHQAHHFKEETALIMEQTASIRPGSKWSKMLELRNGGKIKAQGVQSDGTAFWVGTKFGTKQLTALLHSVPFQVPILEELINCKVSTAHIQ